MKDFLKECNDQNMKESDFMGMFCKVCKNRSCERASWAFTTWDERISTQVDRFFYSPIVKQSEASQYNGIADFEMYRDNTSPLEVWNVVPESKKKEQTSQITTPKQFICISEGQKDADKFEMDVEKNENDVLNTPVQEFIIGSGNMPSTPQKIDEWAIPPKTLKVGGTFKMGK